MTRTDTSGSAAAPDLGSSLTGRFLTALFVAYRAEGVRYVVLRNYERWPEHFGNDIDLIVHADDVQLSHAIIGRIAAAFGLRWTAARRRSRHIVYYLLPAPVDGVERGIALDFRTDLIHRGFVFLPGTLVLESRRLRGGFHVPSPAVETLEILLRCLLDARQVRPSYQERLRQLGAGSTSEFREVAERAVGPALARRLAETLTHGDWAAAVRLRRRVALACARRHPATLPPWFRGRTGAAWDRLRAWFRPPGHLIALVGPAGSYKTALSREICRRFAATRVRIAIPDPEDPALRLQRLVRLRGRLVRGEVVILDRDVLRARGAVHPLGTGLSAEAVLARLIPEPTLIFCLGVETARQIGRDGGRRRLVHEVRADEPLPTVVDRMTEQVMRVYTLHHTPELI